MPNIRGRLEDYSFGDLRSMREAAGADRKAQNRLGPKEHQAFAREATQDSAVRGAAIALATVPYSILKAHAMTGKGPLGAGARRMLKLVPDGDASDPTTSDASFEEVGRAFKGFYQGVKSGSGAKRDLARLGKLYLGVK